MSEYIYSLTFQNRAIAGFLAQAALYAIVRRKVREVANFVRVNLKRKFAVLKKTERQSFVKKK